VSIESVWKLEAGRAVFEVPRVDAPVERFGDWVVVG
jgi:hypothetical protein